MSSKTLNDLIASAISGASEEDVLADEVIEKVASDLSPKESVDFGDIEKVASALEFVGNKGIESFVDIEKLSASEHKTHHPVLDSNEKAQDFSSDKARNPLIDPPLKALFSNANSESIHSKKSGTMKSSGYGKEKVANKALLKEAIAAKIAQRMEN